MKYSNLLLLSIAIFSTEVMGEDNGNQNGPECVTHTVTNQTTGNSSTVTRCQVESETSTLPKRSQRQSGNQQTGSAKTTRYHSYPFKYFSPLDAQISTAESSAGIERYTLWSVVFGFVGSLLLLATLNATRSAAKAANRTALAAENAERAQVYVVVDFQLVWPCVFTSSSCRINYVEPTVMLHNYGKTPAFDVQVDTIFQKFREAPGTGGDMTEIASLDRVTKRYPVFPPSSAKGGVVISPPDGVDPMGAYLNQFCDFYNIWTKVSYKTVFSDQASKPIEDNREYRAILMLEHKGGTRGDVSVGTTPRRIETSVEKRETGYRPTL